VNERIIERFKTSQGVYDSESCTYSFSADALQRFVELLDRDVKRKMCGSSPLYDERRLLTKAKLMKSLKDIPDDIPILINVEFADGENWDTYNGFIANMSTMCPGYAGCTHTEPEMDYDVVLGVKFGNELHCMENLGDDGNNREIR
jgi:hypothetical protein